MDVTDLTACDNAGTEPDFSDDFYKANLRVYHQDLSVGDIIEVTHTHLLEDATAVVTATEINNGETVLWARKMQTDINLNSPTGPPNMGFIAMGTFTVVLKEGSTGNVIDTKTFTFTDINHKKPCSVCTANGGGWNNDCSMGSCSCWPVETPIGPCDDQINFAPDPVYYEHTPIRYIKVILHIFQTEDPSHPQHWSSEHIPLLKSWFTHPDGPNGLLGNVCVPTADPTVHIPDSRIRFLLEHGVEGEDIFFHKNNEHWGISTHGCAKNGQSWNWNYYSLKDDYITSPAPPLSSDYINWISQPEQQNAFHVFISRGHWRDLDGNGQPDPNIEDGNGADCFNPTTGGYNYPSEANCQNNPTQYIMGGYDRYLKILSGEITNETPESLGRQITGEFFHVMTLDHVSPLQIHYQHDFGDDGCEDTNPVQYSNNLLGCDYDHPGGRCHLTQCQIGRMHRFLDVAQPGFERFLVGYDSNGDPVYSMSERNCNLVEPDIVIHDDEIVDWKGPRSIRSNVVVQSGGRLYIRCRIGLPEGATIKVEPGGRLFLYGEVYNNCEGQRWEGVVVNGNSGLPQGFPPTNQGYFVNRGIIEGANTSIRVESGGMVIGIGADVRNSGGMLFEPYSFPQKGWFSGCNFTCDGNIYDFGGNPFKHAELHAVNNVRFGSCNFSVSNVPTGQLSNMAGIVADGSMFRVYSGSTFRDFDTGVHAAGQFSAMNAFTVTGCTFSNNQTGISALGMQNFTVTKNTFEVGGADFQSNSPCGLMMDNCTGYTVEENTFYGQNNTATGRFGIMTQSSGGDANLINGNSFDYLEYSNVAQRQNRGPQQGLQYLCNTNGGNNPRDFYVPDDPFTSNIIDGIHTNQGNGKAAMNTFSHFGTFIDGDFRNEVGVITYNHKNDPAHEPNPNTPPGTGGINKINVQNENTCPSDEPPCDFPCEYTAAEWQQHESAFNTAKSNWQTEKASLLSLMDGGDTDALLTEINGATSLNAGQVVQNLLNRSPWLSTQVLTSTINQKQVLTENSVVQILNANPDGLREAEVRSLVQSSFNQTVADGILANIGIQTARTAKEILVGQYRATMLRKADLLIQDILKDTTEIDVPLLRTWLANKQSLEADYAIVESYLSEGDFSAASQKLDAIPQTYALDAEGVTEHGYFADLFDLWQDVHANGKNMSELDQAGISAVQYIADNSQRRAGAMAKGIMNTWYGGHYRVVPILPGGEGPQGLMAPPTGNSAAPAAKYLSVFPNPARSSVYFYWNLPDGMENAVISITDLQGKLLGVLEVTGQKGKREWSVERLEHGIYIYHVKLPDGNSQISKMVIIK